MKQWVCCLLTVVGLVVLGVWGPARADTGHSPPPGHCQGCVTNEGAHCYANSDCRGFGTCTSFGVCLGTSQPCTPGNGVSPGCYPDDINCPTVDGYCDLSGGGGGCTPAITCASRGQTCGSFIDDCGNSVNCGSCTPCQTCSGSPSTCHGAAGSLATGTCALGSINAGAACNANLDCQVLQVCTALNRCSVTNAACSIFSPCPTAPGTCSGAGWSCPSCTPTTCAAQGKNCGTISDGCSGTLYCGNACSNCQSCGGSGIANVCGGVRSLTCARVNQIPQNSMTVTASATHASWPLSNIKDGDPATLWSAGAGATQWVEFDLGANKPVAGIELLAVQNPDGAATHQVYAGTSSNPATQVAQFGGTFSSGQWLRADFSTGVILARYVRIITTASVSWVDWGEVNLYSGNTATPGVCNFGSCGSSITCGSCCTPATCSSLGKSCGSWSDGCGGTLNCGSCGSGCCTSGTCTVPSTCSSKGWTCGSFTDECNNVVSCGSCAATACCFNNTCVTRRTCQVGECGQFDDNCGGFIDCGLCAAQCAAPESLVPTLNFAAGSLIIPMDICYNPPSASASTGYVDWNALGTSCTTAAAANVPTCYAPSYSAGDSRKPYGLMYLLTINRIPVYIINKPQKIRLTDPDFVVTPPSGSTKNTVSYLNPATGYVADDTKIPCGTNAVSYWGMPFVVDAEHAQQAIRLMKDFSNNPGMYVSGNNTNFDSVPVHVINYPFNAPVLTIRSNRPKPVGVSPTNFFDGFFDEAGITAVAPFGTSAVYLNQTQAPTAGNSMTAQYSFTWPSAYPAISECPGNVCTGLITGTSPNLNRILDVIWTDDVDLQWWKTGSGLYEFFRRGGRVLNVGRPGKGGSYSGALSWETGATSGSNQSGNFVASSGLNGSARNNAYYCPARIGLLGTGVSAPIIDYPASDPYFQLGGLLMDTVGGGQAADFSFKSAALPGSSPTRALWGTNEAAVLHFKPVVPGTPALQSNGDIIYLGSSNAWSGGSGRKDSGLHIMYNVLVNDNDCGILPKYSDVELSRSTPIGKRSGELFLGTFDWKIPLNPLLPGAVLYEPPVGEYPYATGHFRQYFPSAGVGSLQCDPTGALANCSWDAARQMKVWSQRNVYVGQRSGNALSGYSFSLQTAASMTATDATLKYVADHIGIKLGGMDYSTAAVIEGKGISSLVTVAGAAARPTIAYVGSRDGMLHAFCAQSGGCYSNPNTGAPYQPGDEIWALITPGLKASMDLARTTSDWSQLNAGGIIRVGDFKGRFNGASGSDSYRTVLVFGTRSSGRIAALDISDPNPAKVNTDGFRFLWEQDGTDVYSITDPCALSTSTTCPKPAVAPLPYLMGRTQGATFAGNGTTAYLVVTSSLSTSLLGSLLGGVNTYVLRLWDGKVLLSNQKIFTKLVLLAGGSSGLIPNHSPAPAVTVDAINRGDSFDETALITDYDGQVRKFVLTATGNILGFDPALSGVVFDTSVAAASIGNPCPSALGGLITACQPLGAPPAIGVHGPNNEIAAFIATGGADFHRSTSIAAYVFGFDLKDVGPTTSIKTPFFSAPLGSVSLPSVAGTLSLLFPNHAYSQPTISGTDLFVQGTQQALNSINDLINPLMYPGVYGAILRFQGLNQDSVGQATNLIPAYTGTSFSGGGGSVLITNTSANGGQLSLSGSSQMVRVSLDSLTGGASARASKTYAVQMQASGGGTGGRGFNVLSWFDLAQ